MRLQRNILLTKEWIYLLTPILPPSPRSTPYFPTQEEIKVETLKNKLLCETLYKNLRAISMGEILETKGTLGPLELKLQAAVSHHGGIRNQILICRKSSVYF